MQAEWQSAGRARHEDMGALHDVVCERSVRVFCCDDPWALTARPCVRSRPMCGAGRRSSAGWQVGGGRESRKSSQRDSPVPRRTPLRHRRSMIRPLHVAVLAAAFVSAMPVTVLALRSPSFVTPTTTTTTTTAAPSFVTRTTTTTTTTAALSVVTPTTTTTTPPVIVTPTTTTAPPWSSLRPPRRCRR